MDPGTLEKIGGKRVQRGKQGRKEGWRDGRRERVRFQKQPQDGVRRTIFSNCTTSSPEWPFFFFSVDFKTHSQTCNSFNIRVQIFRKHVSFAVSRDLGECVQKPKCSTFLWSLSSPKEKRTPCPLPGEVLEH